MRSLRLAIDAVGIRGHGGASVLLEFLEALPFLRPGWGGELLLLPASEREFEDPPGLGMFDVRHVAGASSPPGRCLWVEVRLPWLIRKTKPDLLLSMANLAPAARSTKQVLLVHQANAFPEAPLTGLKPWDAARLAVLREGILAGARASDLIVVQTAGLARRIARRAPELAERLLVIPAAPRSVGAQAAPRPAVMAAIDGVSRPRLAYVSHPGGQKNHERLIEAFADIKRALPGSSLLLTVDASGSRGGQYSVRAESLVRLCARLGLTGGVHFLGVLTAREVRYLLEQSDLLVFPSLSESFGLGLVEAAAAGCGIIASDLEYARDVAGSAAVYFDPSHPREIAEAVVGVLKTPGELERLRSQSTRLAARYDGRLLTERLCDAMERLVPPVARRGALAGGR